MKDLLSKTELPKILNEGEVLGKLRHPNIVHFLELIQERKQIFFVMEYVSGGSLYHTMKRFGVFPEQLATIYVAQTLQALSYLHQQGILHRDIKGANLLLDANGKIKVADFGACTYAQLDKRLTVIGTPFWMAPEIIEMSGGGTASDIWSLGCTVVELLTGQPPYYTLGSMQALFRMVDDAHPPLPPGASAACQDFLLSCFVKDWQKRPTAAQLLQHEWLRTAAAASAPAPQLMQQTLKQHNATRRGALAAVDWEQQQAAEGDLLQKQARQLRSTDRDEEAIKQRIAKKEKQRAVLARQVEDARATLAQLKKELLALSAEQSKLELAK